METMPVGRPYLLNGVPGQIAVRHFALLVFCRSSSEYDLAEMRMVTTRLVQARRHLLKNDFGAGKTTRVRTVRARYIVPGYNIV